MPKPSIKKVAEETCEPRTISVIIRNKRPANDLPLEVRAGDTVFFENQDDEDYRLRIVARKQGRSDFNLFLGGRGNAAWIIDPRARKGSANYFVVDAFGEEVQTSGPQPIKIGPGPRP